MKKQNEQNETLVLTKFSTKTVKFLILGKTPIILQSMTQKAMRELLMPKGKKTAADKANSLKHDPIKEFRDAPYTDPNEDGPTLLQHLSTAFKASISSAALDMPGAKKSQIGRLTWVEGERVAIYGAPKLFMSVVRSADMNKTPDIRTRCILPEWAAEIEVTFATPVLNETAIASLLASAGLTQGLGDWRPQKGSGNYGQFTLVGDSDDKKRWDKIVANGGREVQIEGMENPTAYDQTTEEMLVWMREESKKRGTTLTE